MTTLEDREFVERMREQPISTDPFDGEYYRLYGTRLTRLCDLAMRGVELGEHPEGCRCPNNGGGDCEWCKIAEGDNQ